MAVLTAMQVAAAAYLGGFRGEQIAVAVAVAKGESAYNTEAGPNSVCNCRGLWQINLDAHPQYRNLPPDGKGILRPDVNAVAAFRISKGGSQWCGRRTSSGKCSIFEAYGKNDANGTWLAKLAEGRTARTAFEREAKRRIDAGPKNIIGRPLWNEKDAAVAILKDAGQQPGEQPELRPPAVDPGDIVGVYNTLKTILAFLTKAENWQRVAMFLGGAILIILGLVMTVGQAGMSRVNAILKATKKVGGASA